MDCDRIEEIAVSEYNCSEYDETENNGDDDNDNDIINIPDVTEVDLTKKETYYFKIIDKYYKSLNRDNVKTMIDIVNGDSNISLRLLDWFITRYSNKYKIRYGVNTNVNDIDRTFNVHISYKAQLKSYKKRYFDPFRRRKKFRYYFDKEKSMELCTTIGQLNFFKWAFTFDVIDYVIKNYNAVSKSMVNTNKLDKTRKTNDKKQKDESDELSMTKNGINVVAKKNIKNNEIKIVLSFD